MTALLEASGLGARAGEVVLLEGVSLRVEAGERVALLGPNGAGKSTLLDLLSGIRTPAAGQVRLDGQDLIALGRRRVAQQVAVVPQLETLPDDLRALDAVLMGRAPHQRGLALPSADDVSMARAALRELDLDGFAERELGTLSGGERQRVLIARALVQRPRLLLLDEPTSALDLGHALYIFHVVKKLAGQGVAVLSTLHDLNQAPLCATRVLILHRGRLVVDDTVEAALQPERLRPWFEVDLVRGELAGRPVLVPA